MDKMTHILSLINLVLCNRGKVEIEAVNEGSHLRNDCDLDSLDLAELTVRIEAEYEVDIFDDGFVVTVGDILNKLN